MSMSIDGYVAGPDVSVDLPMGVGGDPLHDWMYPEPRTAEDAALATEIRAGVGAVVLGRRTFEVGIGPWGDVPYPAPSFVVTHRGRADLPQKSGTFRFVTEGVEHAVALATAAAGERDVMLMGADVCRQALAAGLVDELLVDIAPLVLGGGTRLFEESLGTTFHLRGTVR